MRFCPKLLHSVCFNAIGLIGFLWLCTFYQAVAQPAPTPNFEQTLSQLLAKRDTTLEGIEEMLKPFKHDTVKMQLLQQRSKQNKYLAGEWYAYDALGVAARNKSRYPEALKYHQESLKKAYQLSNIDFRVTSLNMLGVVHRRMDLMRSSLDFHKQALTIAESSGKTSDTNLKSIAVAYNSIGNLYLTLKQYDLAEQQFSQSLRIEEKVGNKLGLAINHQNLGGIYERRNQLAKALESYKQSLKYNNEINSDLGRLICYNSISQIYLKQKRPAAALKLVLPTLKTAEKIGDGFYIAWSCINIGWAYSELDKFDAAEQHLLRVVEVATANKNKSYTANAYRLLSELYAKKGDYKTSLDFLRKYNQFEDEFLNESNQQYVADLIVKYDADKKKTQIQLLEKENELVKIKLKQNRNLISLMAICGLLSAILLYILYRQYQLTNEKKLLGIEQKMMRSQMNPHFIFNSLNSIKLYIINSEKEKAIYYLNKFSKLMRTILNNSQEKEITLAEELETMEMYVNIENIRFSSKIIYSVAIAEDIDPTAIRIPSLILQPFLENAIWHGLSSKEGDKRLTIQIYKPKANEVQIDIIDNGVGRVRANEVNEQRTIKQKSVGVALTQERLESFFKGTEGYTLHFEDLYNPDTTAAGTRVSLILPLK